MDERDRDCGGLSELNRGLRWTELLIPPHRPLRRGLPRRWPS